MATPVNPNAKAQFESDTEKDVGNGFLMELSERFRENAKNLNIALTAALKKLTENSSDPSALAEYQSALSQYTLYRNAQSSVVKAYKDVGAGIIANYR